MSPSKSELSQLDHVARELRDTFGARGHRVEVALDVDPAFGGGTSRSSLRRELAIDAVLASARDQQIDFRSVHGGGKELRFLVNETDRRYRVRKASRSKKGALIIPSSAESALAHETEPSLFPMENWVFAYTFDADGLIEEVLVAEIIGYEAGSPGRLVLGALYPLTTDDAPTGGFTPTEEGLDGFEDSESDDDFGFGS